MNVIIVQADFDLQLNTREEDGATCGVERP